MSSPQRTLADRFLESSLLFALIVHGIGLLTMALMLLPGVPGAGRANPDLRLAYIQAHPLLWHFGWFPWHLSAVSDILFSAALVRARWIPRLASIPTFLLTCVAFVIEQFHETLWDLYAPSFQPLPGFEHYAIFEHHVYIPVTCIAAAIYAFMAVGWSWSLSFASTWNRWLTAISLVAWPLLFFASVTPLLPPSLRAPNLVVNAANQIGFTLMMAFFALALDGVLRRTRLDEPFGRMAPWRAPQAGVLAWAQQLTANSRLLQYLAEFLPTPVLSSHIHDVIYVNYLVEAAKLAPLLPAGLALQTLGPENRFTLFSVLAYRHGRFGPRLLGGGTTCRGFPSPVQSNWRLYVRHPASGEEGIFFTATTLSKMFAALIARVLSRGVPMHVPATSTLSAAYSESTSDPSSTRANLQLTPGLGSSPDFAADLHADASATPSLPAGPWHLCFNSYSDLLAYAVPQGRALSVQSWDGRVTAQEIDLPAPPASCIPLLGNVSSVSLRQLCGDSHPVCFLLPEVHFTMTGERVLEPGRPIRTQP